MCGIAQLRAFTHIDSEHCTYPNESKEGGGTINNKKVFVLEGGITKRRQNEICHNNSVDAIAIVWTDD